MKIRNIKTNQEDEKTPEEFEQIKKSKFGHLYTPVKRANTPPEVSELKAKKNIESKESEE